MGCCFASDVYVFDFPIRPPYNLHTEIVQACQFVRQLQMMIRTWTYADVVTPIPFPPHGRDFPLEEWSQTYSGHASRNATGRICPLRDVDEVHLCHGHFPGNHPLDGLELVRSGPIVPVMKHLLLFQ